jgi:hypothetical protein
MGADGNTSTGPRAAAASTSYSRARALTLLPRFDHRRELLLVRFTRPVNRPAFRSGSRHADLGAFHQKFALHLGDQVSARQLEGGLQRGGGVPRRHRQRKHGQRFQQRQFTALTTAERYRKGG